MAQSSQRKEPPQNPGRFSAWHDASCAVASPESRESKLAVRDLQTRNDGLQFELRRKEKALSEAAALLVLQKKFRALWEEEE
jgi:hypothetical protein